MKHIVYRVIFMMVSLLCYSESFFYHKLKEGETLWRVSLKYNISVDEICEYNNIRDTKKIPDGINLKIPIRLADTYHVVAEGDTLWSISKKYSIPVEELCRLNSISSKGKIFTGMKLLIIRGENNPIKNEYSIPLEGSVKPFVTYHFRGVLIFSEGGKNDVRAVDDGIVTYVDKKPGYGIIVFIKHNNGYISTYSGFKEIYVSHGEKVSYNQIIGIAGNLSRYKKSGLLFSIIYKNKGIPFDMDKMKFVLPSKS